MKRVAHTHDIDQRRTTYGNCVFICCVQLKSQMLYRSNNYYVYTRFSVFLDYHAEMDRMLSCFDQFMILKRFSLLHTDFFREVVIIILNTDKFDDFFFNYLMDDHTDC